MKARMTLLLVLFWFPASVVDAAQSQSTRDGVSARVFNSADINVPPLEPGEWQSLSFNSERWDTANLHETATNSSRLKAPVADKYYIFANITWESPVGTGLWGLRLQLNGKTVIAEQTQPRPGLLSEFQCRSGRSMRWPQVIMSKYKYFKIPAVLW